MISMKAATAITKMIRIPISCPSVMSDSELAGDFVTGKNTDSDTESKNKYGHFSSPFSCSSRGRIYRYPEPNGVGKRREQSVRAPEQS